MHRDPRSIPLCIQHHIQLTSLSFQVSRPSHSWDTTISIFYLGWGKSLKSQRESNILSTHIPFIPCQSAIPFLRYCIFKIWPLIQGQGHGWGERWKSQHGPNMYILSTHIPFIPCQSAIQFLRYNFFKIWPWKSKVKVMGEVNVESHNMDPIFYRLTSLSFHVNRSCHSSDMTFSKFDLENPRLRSWLRSKVKVTKLV